ncbi:hypothetical protein [Nocardia sp. NPDC050710]|uniref:hypothetical protein n=1 Tax=Nocardia sp. NPDC050710 TaxID=3157220 RepID=UPI0033CAF202
MAAIRQPQEGQQDSPLAWFGYRLGVLYEGRDEGPLPVEVHRTADEVISEVNGWIARTVDRGVGGATMAPMSMGELLSRLVRALKLSDSLPMDRIHPAFQRLAQLAEAYDDLASGLRGGRFDLPDYLPGIDWS